MCFLCAGAAGVFFGIIGLVIGFIFLCDNPTFCLIYNIVGWVFVYIPVLSFLIFCIVKIISFIVKIFKKIGKLFSKSNKY